VARNDEEKQAAQPSALIQELITRRQNLASAKDEIWGAGLNTELETALTHSS
jgi:hypothetical protein